MTFLVYPDGERASAAVAPPEAAHDLDPALALPEALERFLRAAAGRHELRVRARDLRFRDGTLLVGSERLRLRPHAVNQLHHRELVRGRGVASGDDLRRGLARLGERVLVLRVEDDEVRAILGARFTPIDDADILGRIARAAEAMNWRDLRVRFVATSERITVVRATLGRSRVDVRPGDPFERGMEIGNSEVGARAFTLSPITWRGRCFNVSIGRPTLRLVHVGSLHRLVRDWRKEVATCLDRARPLIEVWSASALFDAANDITSDAKARPLRARLALERRAQQMIEAGR